MQIRYRLRELIKQWEHEQGEELSYRKLAEKTGTGTATLQRMAHGTNTRIDHETLEKLCTFFEVRLGELMTDQPEEYFWERNH